jgi:signal transduction histidine kinase
MPEREEQLQAAVEVLLSAIQQVVDAWDHGDLAGAVNEAQATVASVRTDLDGGPDV